MDTKDLYPPVEPFMFFVKLFDKSLVLDIFSRLSIAGSIKPFYEEPILSLFIKQTVDQVYLVVCKTALICRFIVVFGTVSRIWFPTFWHFDNNWLRIVIDRLALIVFWSRLGIVR